jgi:hypothetical protein
VQNGLERLLDGIALALREDVLPTVDDAFARSQLLAAAELLANLSGRVEWRCEALAEEVEAIRRVLDRGDEPLPNDNAGLLAARAEALDALAVAQEHGLDTSALRTFLAERLEHELAQLRTGMYR